MSLLDQIAEAPIGVLAYVKRDGTPNAVPVTPYVVDGSVVVTSTLAYVAKAAAVRRNPQVALLAGGVHLMATATVLVDDTPDWFDTHIRADEMAKFPPTRQFLQIPFQSCLFPWYTARVIIEFVAPELQARPGDDRVTIATLGAEGGPVIMPRSEALDLDALVVPTRSAPDGPAVLLVHEESADMSDLRQLTLRGSVRDGAFTVAARAGSLEPRSASVRGQVSTLRTMRRQARANRPVIADWPRVRAS